jgi:acyl-CoA thioester hydrolase
MNTVAAPRATETRVPLRWYDLDAQGHVNQAVYHALMEEARAELLAPLGEFHFVVAHVEMDFRHEVHREHRYLDIELSVSKIGRTSFDVDHRMLLPDGTLAVEGRSVIVAWSRDTRRPRLLCESERSILVAHFLAA